MIGTVALAASLIDSDGGVSGYHVFIGTSLGGSNVFNGVISGTTITLSSSYGQTLYARASAINNIGIEGAASASSTGTLVLDPATIVLEITPAINGLVLTWPGNLSTNFSAACSATNLAPPVLWSPVPGQPVLTGQQWRLAVPATNASRFYRLQLN